MHSSKKLYLNITIQEDNHFQRAYTCPHTTTFKLYFYLRPYVVFKINPITFFFLLPPNLGFVWELESTESVRALPCWERLLWSLRFIFKMSDSTVNAHLEGIISDFEGLCLFLTHSVKYFLTFGFFLSTSEVLKHFIITTKSFTHMSDSFGSCIITLFELVCLHFSAWYPWPCVLCLCHACHVAVLCVCVCVSYTPCAIDSFLWAIHSKQCMTGNILAACIKRKTTLNNTSS